jgi:hypothetical protein
MITRRQGASALPTVWTLAGVRALGRLAAT